MMLQFSSAFKEKIISYCNWREALGFSDDHKNHLHKFDAYCSEFHPNETREVYYQRRRNVETVVWTSVKEELSGIR